MNVLLYNNSKIKIQGPLYYVDCYKWWDLIKSKSEFMSDEYYSTINQLNNKKPFTGQLAVIDICNYSNYNDYYNDLSKNVRRDIKNSRSLFNFKEFCFNDFIPDFLDINYSQNRLKNGINQWYLQDEDFFLGSHCGAHEWQDHRHFSRWYGLFRHMKHYKQLGVTTDEKLVSYCKLCVDGEFACVHLFFSHAQYLKQGVSFHILTSVIEELFKLNFIKCFTYSGFGQYPEWKKRMLFKPVKVSFKI